MPAAQLSPPPAERPHGYPFHIGYRYEHTVDAAGKKTSVMVPLTEEDFLHPQEEDRFVMTDQHARCLHYLRHALATALAGRPKVRTFSDHSTDWQVADIRPHSPDIVVFDEFTADWNPNIGTLPVADLGLDVLLVVEITSASTRHIDLGAKFDEFERVGVPYYLVVDVAAPNGLPTLLAFKLHEERYRELPPHPTLGYLVPRLGLYFRWDVDRLVVTDEFGEPLPESAEVGQAVMGLKRNLVAEKQRAEAEKQRAEAEKQRADSAQKQADVEKQRAEALARELADLKARLSANG